MSVQTFVADNEISIDQAGATLNLDVEQLGSGNLIGGETATAGSMTALDLHQILSQVFLNSMATKMNSIYKLILQIPMELTLQT